ncbi:MAG: phosphonate C-P lyase system protein PhnH [Planctomycetes bacterium]|nr:phosphonate C-P lyase system protein PhnH [Planctomycetota bacterium]
MTSSVVFEPRHQQQAYRRLLQAMSRPGSVQTLPGTSAWLCVLATLCDATVSLADIHERLGAADWPFLQARRANPAQADFVLADGALEPPAGLAPRLGILASPETGATVVLICPSVGDKGLLLELSGPGIESTARLRLAVAQQWLARREQWNAAFPLGVDFIIADESRLVGLPRTTKVKVIED